MVCRNPACLGNYDFNHISEYAIQRFVEGHSTIDLLVQAKTAQEIEEICLVCLLDVDDNVIQKLELSCQNSVECAVTNCRDQLCEIITYQLKCRNIENNFKKII